MGKTNTVKKSTTKQTAKVVEEVKGEQNAKPHIEVDMAKYEAHKTTAGKIRAMAADQIPRATIAKILDIRYQHVRNVLTQPLKRVQS